MLALPFLEIKLTTSRVGNDVRLSQLSFPLNTPSMLKLHGYEKEGCIWHVSNAVRAALADLWRSAIFDGQKNIIKQICKHSHLRHWMQSAENNVDQTAGRKNLIANKKSDRTMRFGMAPFHNC